MQTNHYAVYYYYTHFSIIKLVYFSSFVKQKAVKSVLRDMKRNGDSVPHANIRVDCGTIPFYQSLITTLLYA